MKKRWLCLSLAATLALSAGLLGACTPQEQDPDDDNNNGTSTEYVLPTWQTVPESWDSKENRASVHDPSIFYDEASDTYYAFGTHYAVASSKDLMAWEQVADDGEFSDLYGSAVYKYQGQYEWPAALEATLDLVSPTAEGGGIATTTWAPDVEYYNGKYYMYYSLTKYFGASHSAIGRVESDSVLGPYTNNTLIVNSVGDSSVHPNCIDPELFYDEEGKLWMVYGSASDGIYIKELHNSGDNWGLPIDDGEHAYGTKLWSGTKNQEGPFIFYNEETNYYYLMVSYGDLNKSYNMRVARSENPDGPYVDITGTDVATATGDNGGNKIAGNYIMGDDADGYAALGHNSVIEVDGEYFVVAHVRREEGNGVSGMHNLYVFQLFFNEDGWPVMSPERYAGEKLGTGITQEKLAGEYNVVEHTVGTTEAFAQSVAYTFGADGTITDGDGADAGSWELRDGRYVTITLGSGEDAVAYEGVAAPAYESMYVSREWAMHPAFVFTAVSAEGRSLWAVGTFEAQAADTAA